MPSAFPTLAARRKVKTLPQLTALVRRAKAAGKRVVFTNGCYDLLHPGHVALLEQARQAGDLLVVALNSDRSVRALSKGPGRPIVAERDRAAVMAGLSSVDYIVLFHESTPARVIAALRPDVLVKGADWSSSAIVGRDTVTQRGGRIVRVPLRKGYSTTALIRRIKRSA